MADTKEYNEMLENLFEAMSVIYNEKVKALKFDKTITCCIEDNSNASIGEYIVNDGSTSFKAYSENTNYSNGLYVYVSIPNGDFTLQKNIIGKYMDDNSSYYNYVSPMESFVDITENLIPDLGLIKGTGITANGKEKEVEIWRWTGTKEEAINGYTRLGLRADFQSFLSNYKLIKGNYGLRLDIISDDLELSYYSFELDSSNMYGNPYNFNSYYSQEAVFDISKIANITAMKLSLYQRNNFIDENEEFIKSDIDGVELPSNIFANNCYLSFGYDVERFEDDTILLYSLSSYTFTSNPKITTQEIKNIDDVQSYTKEKLKQINRKTLRLRWIHKNEDGSFDIINEPEELNRDTTIHIYRYSLLEGVKDELAGYFWQELNVENKFLFDVDLDEKLNSEWFKVIIEEPSKEYIEQLIKDDDDINILEAIVDKTEEDERALEEMKAQYYAQRTLIESDILEFNNEIRQADEATLKQIKGLELDCDNNGIYNIYGRDGKLLQPSDAFKYRRIYANYTTVVAGQERLDTLETVTWRIPVTNTMIQMPVDGLEYKTEEDDRFTYNIGDSYCTITRFYTPTEDKAGIEIENSVFQNFRIKDYYNINFVNNTIYCEIEKTGFKIEKSFDLVFGTAGTNGTDYTLTIELKDTQLKSVTAANINNSDSYHLVAKLYDYMGNDITDEYKEEFKWSWYSYNTMPLPITPIEKTDSDLTTIDLSDVIVNPGNYSQDSLKYLIAQVEVKVLLLSNGEEKTREVILSAKQPIAINYLDEVYSCDCPTSIAYDPTGTNPKYYKGRFGLYKNDGTEVDGDFEWIISLGKGFRDEEGTVNVPSSFYPKISVKNTLIPTAIYYQNLSNDISIEAYKNGNLIYTQPLYIYQDSYTSGLLNNWDGNLTIDENNGTILSTMIGAGIKNDNNTFSGILMGDIKESTNTNSKIGLYGYHEGAQSYGFMIDGTAFIGKSGGGRILFDGNTSKIESQSFSTSKDGISIDLDDGTFTAQKGRAKVLIDVNSDDRKSNPLFNIVGEDGKQLMRVSDDEFYLQSSDYNQSAGKESGIKISLYEQDSKGNVTSGIRAYNAFELLAYATAQNYIYTATKYLTLEDLNNYFEISNSTDIFNFVTTVLYSDNSSSSSEIANVLDIESIKSGDEILFRIKNKDYIVSNITLDGEEINDLTIIPNSSIDINDLSYFNTDFNSSKVNYFGTADVQSASDWVRSTEERLSEIISSDDILDEDEEGNASTTQVPTKYYFQTEDTKTFTLKFRTIESYPYYSYNTNNNTLKLNIPYIDNTYTYYLIREVFLEKDKMENGNILNISYGSSRISRISPTIDDSNIKVITIDLDKNLNLNNGYSRIIDRAKNGSILISSDKTKSNSYPFQIKDSFTGNTSFVVGWDGTVKTSNKLIIGNISDNISNIFTQGGTNAILMGMDSSNNYGINFFNGKFIFSNKYVPGSDKYYAKFENLWLNRDLYIGASAQIVNTLTSKNATLGTQFKVTNDGTNFKFAIVGDNVFSIGTKANGSNPTIKILGKTAQWTSVSVGGGLSSVTGNLTTINYSYMSGSYVKSITRGGSQTSVIYGQNGTAYTIQYGYYSNYAHSKSVLGSLSTGSASKTTISYLTGS